MKKLYKKTNTGAIQEWGISVLDSTIITQYGQVGGKMQITSDTLKAGKNIGHANETTATRQAIAEAESRWLKKKKSGYVESIEAARAGATDEVIEGGVVPMLAKVFEDYQSKIKYPIAVQPKLDGHRCIAVVDDKQSVSLWTRTRKRITSAAHIELEISMIAKSRGWRDIIFDGELYNHDLKDDFERLTGAVRRMEASEDSGLIQYHIYDTVSSLGFSDRMNEINQAIGKFKSEIIKLVPTFTVLSEATLFQMDQQFVSMGYEGTMVRLLDMPYENKRSSQLLKLKTFQDEEFEITGVEEGRGKLAGHVGAFICEDKSGKEFRAKMAGETKRLKEMWNNQRQYIGSLLTVQFQGKTKDGIPRFPVGLRIREDL